MWRVAFFLVIPIAAVVLSGCAEKALPLGFRCTVTRLVCGPEDAAKKPMLGPRGCKVRVLDKREMEAACAALAAQQRARDEHIRETGNSADALGVPFPTATESFGGGS